MSTSDFDERGAPPYRNALVVANPISGRGVAVKAAEELGEGLRSRGVATEIYFTTKAGDAFTRLRTQRESVDLVVSVGGDGTLREVLDGLVDPSIPVGMLPFGTANVLATELALPRDVHLCLENLLRGHVREVDAMRVNGKLSLLMAGIGIDALAVREVERRRKGPITMFTYVGAVLRALARYRPPRLTVELDGERVAGEWGFVLVSNTVNYGGVLRLAPDARMDDGRVEAYLFPKGTIVELAVAFARGVVSNLPGGRIVVRQARRLRITSDEPVPFQVDGDLGGTTPVEIEIARNTYRLAVP